MKIIPVTEVRIVPIESRRPDGGGLVAAASAKLAENFIAKDLKLISDGGRLFLCWPDVRSKLRYECECGHRGLAGDRFCPMCRRAVPDDAQPSRFRHDVFYPCTREQHLAVEECILEAYAAALDEGVTHGEEYAMTFEEGYPAGSGEIAA